MLNRTSSQEHTGVSAEHLENTAYPIMPKGFVADMHTHSEHSHDSVCPIKDMAESQKSMGTAVFAVTDHCDIEYFDTQDLEKIIGDSVANAESLNIMGATEILRGIEIGEGFWHPDVTRKILSMTAYDVVIGSVHAVKFPHYTMPYSTINFAAMGKATAKEYFGKYLNDVQCMIETTACDILAHLTCPLRYMNGKYRLDVDCKPYKSQITTILHRIIEKEIALEINTSCKGSHYDEFMPEEWIVSLYKELGGHLVTLGSDAHIAKNASHDFDKAIDMLKRNGFDSAYYYKNRTPYPYAL